MDPDRERMYSLQSEVCKAMGNPHRLAILDFLRDGEMTVGAISEALGRSISNTSQHLTVLKSAGMVKCRKEGTTCHYRVSSPAIFKAFDCMENVLLEGAAEKTAHLEYLQGRSRQEG